MEFIWRFLFLSFLAEIVFENRYSGPTHRRRFDGTNHMFQLKMIKNFSRVIYETCSMIPNREHVNVCNAVGLLHAHTSSSYFVFVWCASVRWFKRKSHVWTFKDDFTREKTAKTYTLLAVRERWAIHSFIKLCVLRLIAMYVRADDMIYWLQFDFMQRYNKYCRR